MNKQKQIINELFLDFKRNSMGNEDFYHLKTNNILLCLVSKFKENNYKSILIENYTNTFDNFVLANIAAAAAQFLEVPLLIVGKGKTTALKVCKSFPNVVYKRKVKLNFDEYFCLSPKSAIDYFINRNCDCKYTKIDYYPLYGMLPLDLKTIAEEYYDFDFRQTNIDEAQIINKYGFEINFGTIQLYCMGYELIPEISNKIEKVYKGISSPIDVQKQYQTIVVFPNCDSEAAISIINGNPNSNVVYLVFSLEELKWLKDFEKKVIRPQNSPLIDLNIFEMYNDNFCDSLQTYTWICSQYDERYEDIKNIIEEKTKVIGWSE